MGNYKNDDENNFAAAAAHTLLMADTVISIESSVCGEIWGSYGSDLEHYCLIWDVTPCNLVAIYQHFTASVFIVEEEANCYHTTWHQVPEHSQLVASSLGN